jgi:hypothetical protein
VIVVFTFVFVTENPKSFADGMGTTAVLLKSITDLSTRFVPPRLIATIPLAFALVTETLMNFSDTLLTFAR